MDVSAALIEQVLQAKADGTPLNIQGGGSKAFLGRSAIGEALAVAGHRGIIEYEPTELVITARSGTPLAEIEAALAEKGQMLPFEPPHFRDIADTAATLGGTVACGLSGPRRAYAHSVRDAVLGVKLINGKGEILSFGGQVIKNVAGFDVSRLQVGAMGTLGVLLEVSLRVAARPEAEQTLVFEMGAAAALASMIQRSGQHWPLSGACHDGSRLYFRLSGSSAALQASRSQLGGEILADAETFWTGLRDHQLPFFKDPASLCRICLPPATPPLGLPGTCFIDWGGALRWLKTDAPAEAVFDAAREASGHANLFRHADRSGRVFQALPARLQALHINLKQAFDPDGLFNRGRLYPEW